VHLGNRLDNGRLINVFVRHWTCGQTQTPRCGQTVVLRPFFMANVRPVPLKACLDHVGGLNFRCRAYVHIALNHGSMGLIFGKHKEGIGQFKKGQSHVGDRNEMWVNISPLLKFSKILLSPEALKYYIHIY